VIARRMALVIGSTWIAAVPAAARERIDLGALAQCISDSGARFYGAHWCPFCRKQKEYFEGHARALPYVECYDGDKSEGMNSRCKRAHVESFPTWVFADGTVQTGALSPSDLAAATGCD
jgi:glutaredoxin